MPTSVSSSSCNNKNGCCSDQTPSSSSSIGKNSDLSEEDLSGKFGDGEEEEVQSKCKGGPLDAMDALEEVLPIRRGISRFYDGKSKTFASLIDASLSSVKEIAKPNNAFARRRRNLLAHSLRGNAGGGGGISKRASGSGRSTLGLAMAMTGSQSDFSSNDMSSWRSYSLSDLQQQCVAGVGTSCSNLYAKPT